MEAKNLHYASQKRAKTEQHQYSLQKVISKVSQQKLFSKLLIQFSTKLNNKGLLNNYRKQVQHKFTQQLRSPLVYNPEQAYTHRQKFRKKVLMLLNKQLDIDYFQKHKSPTGKIDVRFKGSAIDDDKNPKTKKQFQIFKDFTQKKFKQSYMSMFDQKLQLKHQKLFRYKRYRLKTTQCATQDIYNLKKQQTQSSKKQIKQSSLKIAESKLKIQESVMPSIIIKPKSHYKLKPHIQKLQIGKRISDIDNKKIALKIKQIGGYSTKISDQSLLLTKESISKYFKSQYEREHRLIDFLQIKATLSLSQYKIMCTKINLMPNDHIMFMTFLYYDFNNDGFICQNDLRRIGQLAAVKSNPIILEDVKIIRKKAQNFSYQLQTLQNQYIQLYKLPEITQTTYFIWKRQMKKNNQKKQINVSPSQTQNNQTGTYSKKSTERCNTIQTKISGQQNQANQLKTKNQKYGLNNIDKILERGQNKSQETKKLKINAFNPSILQNQSAEVRKYLLSIKKKKMYLNFQNFRNLYIFNQNKTISKPFLWYDLMNKLASIKFQGLRYEN